MASTFSFLCFFLLCSLSLGFSHEEGYPYPYTPGGGDEEVPYPYPYSPGGGGGGEYPHSPPYSPSGGGGGEHPHSPPHTPSGGGGEGEKEETFLLPKAKQVLRGEAGGFRVVKGFKERGIEKPPMYIGFIDMEPQSLFLPQYLDSNLILFLRRGSAKIGWINKTSLAETNMKKGDVFRIPAGSTFYIVNTGEGQILQLICSIDTTDSLGMGAFQSFFVAGGKNPRSIITGFGSKTVQTAFNVSSKLLEEVFKKQDQGPVIFARNTTNTSSWNSILQLKHQELHQQVDDEDDSEDGLDSWIWRKLMNFVVSPDNTKKNRVGKSESTETKPYNIYDRNPDFKNNYGTTKAITRDDYEPLGKSGKYGVGVYLVNLTAGAMLAPHINPSATEFGIVLQGSGSVQIVYPNGTTAMNEVVNEGDVFWVPQFFPFCHLASRNGPFVFFGFTTNAIENNPQFLAGESSVFKTINSPELAMSLGVDKETLDRFINAQKDSIILTSAAASPPHQPGEGGKGGSGEHGKGDKGGHGKGGSGQSQDDLNIELWA